MSVTEQLTAQDYLAYLRARSKDGSLSKYERNVALSMVEMIERREARERGDKLEVKKRRLGYAIGRRTTR